MCGFSSPTLRKIKGATRWHKDGAIVPKRVHNGMCPASELRNMSIIIALNCDPEQGCTIKLKRGQAVAFPPYWTRMILGVELYDTL